MTYIDADIVKVNDLLTNMENEIKEYDKNIDLFFKEFLSNSSWIGNASEKYKEYVRLHMIEYSDYSESFKKFINTTRNSISELETVVNNNLLE